MNNKSDFRRTPTPVVDTPSAVQMACATDNIEPVRTKSERKTDFPKFTDDTTELAESSSVIIRDKTDNPPPSAAPCVEVIVASEESLPLNRQSVSYECWAVSLMERQLPNWVN